MIKLCIKDVLRNRFFLPILLALNIAYIVIQFQSMALQNKILWRYETFYVIVIAGLVPLVLHLRYGDKNREIIKNSVAVRVENVFSYYFYYVVGIWLVIELMLVVSIPVICLGEKGDVQRSLLFSSHVGIVAVVFCTLYIALTHLIGRYMIAWVIYLVSVFVIMLVNAPDSYIWFLYGTGDIVVEHWHGKCIMLVSVLVLYGISRIRKRLEKR